MADAGFDPSLEMMPNRSYAGACHATWFKQRTRRRECRTWPLCDLGRFPHSRRCWALSGHESASRLMSTRPNHHSLFATHYSSLHELDPASISTCRCELRMLTMKPASTSTSAIMVSRKKVDVPACGTSRNSISITMNSAIARM
jgi:hypothetical protein